MNDKENYSFHYYTDGETKLHDFNYEPGVNPIQVYRDFLYFLNTVYGWDVENTIATLYAKEGT